jgi:predicted amidohydrolase
LFILTSASPGRGLGKQPALESARWVEDINRGYANLFTSFVVHSNRAGFEDGLNFWGGSTIYNPNGELITKGAYHEEALVTAVIDLEQLHRTRSRLPLLRDERAMLMLNELQRIMQCKQCS